MNGIKPPMCLNNYRLINKSNKIHDLGVACGATQSNREQTKYVWSVSLNCALATVSPRPVISLCPNEMDPEASGGAP